MRKAYLIISVFSFLFHLRVSGAESCRYVLEGLLPDLEPLTVRSPFENEPHAWRLNEEQRSAGVVFTDSGKLVDQSGLPLHQYGSRIFVIDYSGRYLHFSREIVELTRSGNLNFYHSSFGTPVLFAGESVYDQGKFLKISNLSGHYRPSFKRLLLLAKGFQQRGLLSPQATVAISTGLSRDHIVHTRVPYFVETSVQLAIKVYEQATKLSNFVELLEQSETKPGRKAVALLQKQIFGKDLSAQEIQFLEKYWNHPLVDAERSVLRIVGTVGDFLSNLHAIRKKMGMFALPTAERKNLFSVH